MVLTALTWALLGFGSLMILTGGIGLLRLPDFFSRMHGAGLTDTIGAGSVILGLILESGFSAPTVRLVLVLLFLWYTSPVGGYAISRAALEKGVRPFVVEGGDPDVKGN